MHIYVHIPYCLQKCRYCAFASVAEAVPSARYVDAVLAEAGRRLKDAGNRRVATLYLGGGTPSLLDGDDLARLVAGVDALVPLAPDVELTVEANPETIDERKARALKAAGFNRVSLGMQSFTPRLLKYLGRIHSVERAEEAYARLRAAGFANLNLDLIYGMPVQTREELEYDLDRLIALKPEHASAYLFTHEPGTCFEDVAPINEELGAVFFRRVIERLNGAGLTQYEISNFARDGFESRHNGSYWRGAEYLGLGAAAVSRMGATRWRNTPDPGRYLDLVEAGGDPVAETEELTPTELAFEGRFLGLRTTRGIPRAQLPQIPEDLYVIHDGRASLTVEGMLLSDEIFSLL